MLKISSKNTFILKEVAQPYRSDQILHMQLQQEALSTTCLGLPNFDELKKNGTIENRNVIPGSGESADK